MDLEFSPYWVHSKTMSNISHSHIMGSRALSHHGRYLNANLDEDAVRRANITKPMQLLCDNTTAIHIANNPIYHDIIKHIEADSHYIREKVNEGVIDLKTPALRHSSQKTCPKLDMMNCYPRYVWALPTHRDYPHKDL